MAYQIAFFGEAGSYVLPINPPKFPVKNSADHTTVNILGSGEAVRPGSASSRAMRSKASSAPIRPMQG